MLVTTVQKTIPPQNKFNLLSFIPSTYYCLSNVLSYKYNKNKIQKSTKHVNHSAFFIKHCFVPFFFSHPPYLHLLHSYRKNKIANLVRRRYKEGTKEELLFFFSFFTIIKNRRIFHRHLPMILSETSCRAYKKWLHPLPWMATPFKANGYTIRNKGCSPGKSLITE